MGGDTQLLLLKDKMYILGEEAQMGSLDMEKRLTGNCVFNLNKLLFGLSVRHSPFMLLVYLFQMFAEAI